MSPEEKLALLRDIGLMRAKLDILRNFQIVADSGMRQQQSAANDEIISVIRDISGHLLKFIRLLEK